LRYLTQLSNYINLLVTNVVILIAILCVVLGGVNVVNRSLIHYSLPWTGVLTRYLLIWLTFLGVTILVKKNNWIRIDFLVSKLDFKKQVFFNFIYYFILFVFSSVLLIKGIDLILMSAIRNQEIPTLYISQLWLYLSAPLAGFIILIHLFVLVWQLINTRGVS